MKKLILLSILLIVGCAHKPTAQFYIGMTGKEFIKTNDLELSVDGFYSFKSKNGIIYQRLNDRYSEQHGLGVCYYIFEHDSLIRVSKGIFNNANEKHVDYDKYATPPEWFAG